MEPKNFYGVIPKLTIYIKFLNLNKIHLYIQQINNLLVIQDYKEGLICKYFYFYNIILPNLIL